ncbi:12952_t:CDS:2 [Funneliformis geosporum]|uniref:12952_t:CDS:1 n=1 Tax=Funneliformis geosporum TaxID=1117311 RepID=A0A9W4X6H9_9GLOM|nr:12952_t:CDS:2 [Funneliformis geosporum]
MGKPGGQNNATYSYLELQEMNHVSVDPDSDLRLKINEDLLTHNVENNTFAVKNDMYALLTVVSEDAINRLFDNIQMIESVADWVIFYRQRWVIASLDRCISKIDTIYNHQKYNVPNRGCDKNPITQNVQSNKRKALIQIKKSNTLKSKSMLVKHKQNVQSGNKKRSRKTIVIDSDTEVENEDGKENKLTSKFNELEYQEKDLALKERKLV